MLRQSNPVLKKENTRYMRVLYSLLHNYVDQPFIG